MNSVSEILIATPHHVKYAEEICSMMEEAARVRGTGIAKRSVEYVSEKMHEGKAIIALNADNVIGFCYIETWEGGKYLANSGLIVHQDYRNTGLARKIKSEIFKLSRIKYPNAKIFGITTSYAVMKINSDLGYKPVTFSELTVEDKFWSGCQNCVNYDVLTRTERKFCLCTGMMYDPQLEPKITANQTQRWERFKAFMRERIRRPQLAFLSNFKLNKVP